MSDAILEMSAKGLGRVDIIHVHDLLRAGAA
jgi:hypothetical protein